MSAWTMLPAIASGQGGCACCPPKPITAPMDMQPHPGFGGLTLLCDGDAPDGWWDFCELITDREGYYVERRGDYVTMQEIEEAVGEDPDHDWRLHIYGPMSEYTYQRQGVACWVLVEKGMGFA